MELSIFNQITFAIILAIQDLGVSAQFEFYPCDCLPHKHLRDVLVCCEGPELTEVPQNLTTTMTKLKLHNGNLKGIHSGDFDQYTRLTTLFILNLPELNRVDAIAFKPLHNLLKLWIKYCPMLQEINGTLLEYNPRIHTVEVTDNGLEVMPKMKMRTRQKGRTTIVWLTSNKIQRLTASSVVDVHLRELILEDNQLDCIEDNAFINSQITNLNLRRNTRLVRIYPKAFQGLTVLKSLDISQTSVEQLPEFGMHSLEQLFIQDTESLKMLPTVLAFTNLKEAEFTYPYHCCFFKYVTITPLLGDNNENLEELRRKYCKEQKDANKGRNKRAGTWGTWGISQNTTSSSRNTGLRVKGDFVNPISHNTTYAVSDHPGYDCDDVFVDHRIQEGIRKINCTPLPDVLNPCEDITGYLFLRVLIWFVWTAAVAGNIGVICVLLITNNERVKTHNFLMGNLAFADLCMGIYLAILANKDIRTAGVYYNYAVDWQTSGGCEFAGFLTVLSSQLSVYTMLIISFDVWYNTRYVFWGKCLSFKVILLLMAIGWIYSLTMAILPLGWVSTYTATSICLPLQVLTVRDRVFIVGALSFNTVAFCLICFSYIGIYLSVAGNGSSRGNPSLQKQDLMIAKRMAILIGTNFICWGPIILFAIAAVSRKALIDISTAKILLIVFFPINSCANPFLYVFLTKQYRNEVSRVLKKQVAVKRWLITNLQQHRPSLLSSTSTPNTVISRISGSTRKSDSTPRSSDGSVLSGTSFNTIDSNTTADNERSISRMISKLSRKFEPQMSDIIENSHSNSLDEPENYAALLPKTHESPENFPAKPHHYRSVSRCNSTCDGPDGRKTSIVDQFDHFMLKMLGGTHASVNNLADDMNESGNYCCKDDKEERPKRKISTGSQKQVVRDKRLNQSLSDLDKSRSDTNLYSISPITEEDFESSTQVELHADLSRDRESESSEDEDVIRILPFCNGKLHPVIDEDENGNRLDFQFQAEAPESNV